jgi:hypothetical protein
MFSKAEAQGLEWAHLRSQPVLPEFGDSVDVSLDVRDLEGDRQV